MARVKRAWNWSVPRQSDNFSGRWQLPRDHFVVDVAGAGAGGLKWVWKTRLAGDESRESLPFSSSYSGCSGLALLDMVLALLLGWLEILDV
jgi:hypothetical protein